MIGCGCAWALGRNLRARGCDRGVITDVIAAFRESAIG
jgi:hypothetical protein